MLIPWSFTSSKQIHFLREAHNTIVHSMNSERCKNGLIDCRINIPLPLDAYMCHDMDSLWKLKWSRISSYRIFGLLQTTCNIRERRNAVVSFTHIVDRMELHPELHLNRRELQECCRTTPFCSLWAPINKRSHYTISVYNVALLILVWDMHQHLELKSAIRAPRPEAQLKDWLYIIRSMGLGASNHARQC